MRTADFLRTLSGCRFYRTYCEQQRASVKEGGLQSAGASRPPPEVAAVRADRDRVFKKYGVILAAMVFGSLLLIVTPMWLAYAPFGKACLLSLPPMLLCAASWMAGAWWGSDKPQHVLMAATLGCIPIRVLVALGWAWLCLAIPGMPMQAFFLALMFHWILFACAEIGMLVELSRLGPEAKAVDTRATRAGLTAQYRIDPAQRKRPSSGSANGAEPTPAPTCPVRGRELVGTVP